MWLTFLEDQKVNFLEELLQTNKHREGEVDLANTGQLGFSRVPVLTNSHDANDRDWHHHFHEERERVCASCKLDGQQRAVPTNVKLDSWHTSQDPPCPHLQDQAVLTPIECIEKVKFSVIHNFLQRQWKFTFDNAKGLSYFLYFTTYSHSSLLVPKYQPGWMLALFLTII